MSGLSCGIVGLPNVGKSTFFNALTKKKAEASNYPFCTIDPNKGIVEVPDRRLEILAKLTNSKKIVPAVITFVDIAGLVKGASKGEGLGNQFLGNIRETDILVHVVRCFENDEVVHVEGKVDPIGDIETIHDELIFADFQMVENILTKLEKQAKSQKELLPKLHLLQKIANHLDQMLPVRSCTLSEEETDMLRSYNLITAKPVVYAANISEEDIEAMSNPHVERVQEIAKKEKNFVVPFCAKFEEELMQLSEEEAREYLEALNIRETGLDRIIRICFQTLGLITFLTTGEIETRAWTIRKGTHAKEAAGKIHTDIQKGFIRAEVVTFEDMVKYQGRGGAKTAGKARLEGKEYLVQDGDVILFHHNA